MKRIIRLTESDLTRIVRRVLREAEESTLAVGDDPKEFHRHSDGGNPGIEKFLENPLDEAIADELEQQLENDPYAKNTKTNLGKGTGKMVIEFNFKKMTPVEFIDQVQEDAKEGICHTITSYEYDNRIIRSTIIKIRTDEKSCIKGGSSTKTDKKQQTDQRTDKKSTVKKKPKKCVGFIPYDSSVEKNLIEAGFGNGYSADLVHFQKYCIGRGLYEGIYNDGTNMIRQKCTKADGIWGCCSSHCFRYSPIPKG